MDMKDNPLLRAIILPAEPVASRGNIEMSALVAVSGMVFDMDTGDELIFDEVSQCFTYTDNSSGGWRLERDGKRSFLVEYIIEGNRSGDHYFEEVLSKTPFERPSLPDPVAAGPDHLIKRISKHMANLIINIRAPQGVFFYHDRFSGKYIGIDNSTRDAWTEEFPDPKSCLRWLAGKTDFVPPAPKKEKGVSR